MSQNNNSYQDLIINNGAMTNMANIVTSDAGALQGLQMANQFAICANPGSTPLLVPCITPMLLSPQSAGNKQSGGPFTVFVSKMDNAILQSQIEGGGGGGVTTSTANHTGHPHHHSQQQQHQQHHQQQHQIQHHQLQHVTLPQHQQLHTTTNLLPHQLHQDGGRTQQNNNNNNQANNNNQNISHIQLANNIAIPANMAAANNLPFGISYINLSSLTNQQGGGTTLPIQIALNSNNNQQITLPLTSITQLTNDLQCGHLLQLSNAYVATSQQPQIKFESELVSSGVGGGSGTGNDQMGGVGSVSVGGDGQKVGLEKVEPLDIDNNNNNGNQDNVSGNVGPGVVRGKRGRKRKVPASSNNGGQFMRRGGAKTKSEAITVNGEDDGVNNGNKQEDSSLMMYDNKGRPFVYECTHCPKKFTQNSRLTAHLRCHSGIRPYTCTQCGFSFTQKSYLIRHAAVHKEDRPFTCNKCLKTYKHYGSLANHRKLHCREAGGGGGGGQHHHQNQQHSQHQQSYIQTSFTDPDDLDDTIQRAIDSAQLSIRANRNRNENNNNSNNNSGNNNNSNNLSATTTALIQQQHQQIQQATSSVSGNHNVMLYSPPQQQQQQPLIYTTTISSLPGSGPVVFPSQEQLPSLSAAVSLLQPQQQQQQSTNLNDLKAGGQSSASATTVVVSSVLDSQHHQNHLHHPPQQLLDSSSNSNNNNNHSTNNDKNTKGVYQHIKQDSAANYITVTPLSSHNDN